MRRPLPSDRLLDAWADRQGLSLAEVDRRRSKFGRNQIVEFTGNRWITLARDTARDPMIWFLIVTGIVYALLGNYLESLTLLIAILPLVGMDAFLHRRTQASTEGLSKRLATTANVIRDGKEMQIPAEDLVPGDVVYVTAGQPFPADGIILDAKEVQVDESSLTGEAFPVRKHPPSSPPLNGIPTSLEDTHWGLAGTRLLTGKATARVIFTGADTLYGEIVHSAAAGSGERTPLQVAISNLVTILVLAAGALCLVLAVVRVQQGFGWIDAFMSAATLAIAALPEEFPVVFTAFLGVGVYRLARRQALVRKGVSVENIGRVTCICVDKTGTLTQGRLTIADLVPAQSVSSDRLLTVAAAASRRETGDPLDLAILEELKKRQPALNPIEILETFPFTEDRRRETSVVRSPEGGVWVASKGAAETIFQQSNLSPDEINEWRKRAEKLAGEGKKVIACASYESHVSRNQEPAGDYKFQGLIAFSDPVREGAAEAVKQCRDAGIRVIMITGDHPSTAQAIARMLALGGGSPRVIDSSAPDFQPEQALRGADNVDVFARAYPSQKLAIVRALQAKGEIVAVTGDGVNDVPALQAADVGIAMGETGTRSARESASIVLLDDNFRTIVQAIAEGRRLLLNLQLSFEYLLMIHIPLVITATLIPLGGYPLLYLPIHIIWLEAIIHPTALLVFQGNHSAAPLGARTNPHARFFTPREWVVIGATGTLLTAFILFSYIRGLGPTDNAEHARALALAILTLSSAVITATLSRFQTFASKILTVETILLTVTLIQIPFLARWIHLQPLHADDWFLVFALAVVGVVLPRLLLFRAQIKRSL